MGGTAVTGSLVVATTLDEAVRELAGQSTPMAPPDIGKPPIDLRGYDALIPSRGAHV